VNDDLALALEAASINAGKLQALLMQNGDAAGATQASTAKDALFKASEQADAVDAMQKLATTAAYQQNLTDLTGGMNAATAALAQDEANLAKFVSLGTQAVKLATALAAGPLDIPGAMGAIQSMIGTLGL